MSVIAILENIFSHPYMTRLVVRALIVGVLVSLCASLLGVSLVLKRLSMIGDGLSHVGFGALAVATVLDAGDYSMAVSLPIVVAAAVLLMKLSQSKRVKGDSAIAIFSTGAIAVGSLIFNASDNRMADVCNSLFGSASIITIGDSELWMSIVLSAAVIAFFVLCYGRIFAVTFDESFAKATGVKVERCQTLIAVFTAVTIVLGMKMMGAIMISALIVFPALGAMRVCGSFRGVVIGSAVISVVCFLSGFGVACAAETQTGATVATVELAAFLLCALAGALMSARREAKSRAEEKQRLGDQ